MNDNTTFYQCLKNNLNKNWDSIDIYSISACFGFYSEGMNVFSDILISMKDALTKPGPYRTDSIRCLIHTDDNPIDNFAIDRFYEYLIPNGLQLRKMKKPNKNRWLQFAIFKKNNHTELLCTEPQIGQHIESLKMGINPLKPIDPMCSETNEGRYEKIFEKAWSIGNEISHPIVPNLNKLVKEIDEKFQLDIKENLDEKDEEELEKALFHFLHGLCPKNMPIYRQFPIGNNKMDLVIGEAGDQIAIELKASPDTENDIKRLIGQIETYRTVIPNILIIVITKAKKFPKERSLKSLINEYKGEKNIRFLWYKI